VRSLFLSAVCAVALSAPAMAASYVFTDVAAVYPDNAGIIDVPTQEPPPWTTPIVFTTSGGQTFTTYCDDLGHNVFIEGGQNLTYETALVTTDGEGHAISEAVSNVMGQIARLGLLDAAHGDQDGAIAANGAIWGLEYGVHVTSPNATIQSDLDAFVSNTHDDGRGWALGLVDPLQGDQAQILPSAAVPEPSTWLMALIGFACIGFSIFRQRLTTVSQWRRK
jgi:hypothetical protein